LLTGVALVVVCGSLRLGETALHRWLALREPPRESLRIGAALLPTLVFTLVVADILRARAGTAPELLGALVIYATLITLIPGLFLHTPVLDYAAPHLDSLAAAPPEIPAIDAPPAPDASRGPPSVGRP